MAAARYEPNFLSVLPVQRDREKIVADLQVSLGASATDIAKGKVAEIELHIKNGDEAFKQGSHSAALTAFKKARALIYKSLQPSFDADSFVGSRVDVLLPNGKNIERQLMDTSLRMVDGIRPKDSAGLALFVLGSDVAANLTPFTQTGFRESVTVEQSLQWANEQGIAFLADNKPAAAAGLLSEALKIAQQNNKIDVGITAASSLNLAAAFLELNDANQAAAMADGALQLYKQKKDTVGQAQALHMAAVVAARQGKAEQSKKLLNDAAAMLKAAQGGAQPGPVVPGPAGPVPSAARFNGLQPRGLSVSSLVRKDLLFSIEAPRLSIATSQKIDDLKPIAAMDAKQYTYRIPGRRDGWGAIEFTDERVRTQQAKEWMIGVPVGNTITVLPAASGKVPSVDQLVAAVYKKRMNAERFRDIDFNIVDTSTTTFYLTHLYSYGLPVRIGDCYKALGQYANAENYYITASAYSFINLTLEATALWIRMAQNVLAWGDSLYKGEDLDGAKAQYAKLVTPQGQVPAPPSYLYNTATLKVPADEARKLLQNIQARPIPAINWEIAMPVLIAFERSMQIADNLDFYGLALSPIHTFEYLQSVARSFAQETMQAESEFINFKSRQEQEEANRRDLETAKAMADAEVQGRFELWQSALDDEQSARAASDLATRRRNDAITQRNAYANSSWDQIWAQAASAALGGGEDAYWSEISELADKLDRGETIHGPGPKLAAAQILSAGRKTRDYELEKMQDTIDQLTAAITVSNEQLQAAQRRAAAAEIAWQAALQRAQMATASLDAFDSEFFTPESWQKMAEVMRDIAHSFLWRAIRIAKLMERAYNFENDTDLKVIKNEYGFKVGNPASSPDAKLLGGDRLLLDIESFTYAAITTKTRKNSRIKDVISIAGTYPAHFEQFRSTGLLSIETDLYEFDRLHPGFYGQRIEAVEINIVGLLPEGSTGLNGSVSAGGVTAFRKKDGTLGKRVHQIDTMALSDFQMRNDIFLYSSETGVRGLFQGLGLGSTWELHLPKRSNDFDFRRIFDVQFVFYYTAKFDSLLRTNVLAQPPRPGEMSLLRNFGLRYDFPDAWYAFYHNGAAQISLDRARLPTNQQNFKVMTAFLRVITKAGVSANAITVKVTAPDGSTGTVTTNADGVMSSLMPALAALAGGTPIGQWKVEVLDGASLKDAGVLKFDRVYNIQFGLEYSYEAIPEAL
jgi:hypothetical protein